MKETATVKTISDRRVVLSCNDDEHCVGCAASAGCGSRERVYEAENPRDLALVPGDQVVVDLPRRSAVGAGALVFLLPIVLFISFYLLSSLIVPEPPDPLRALSGLLGLAAGFGIALLVGRLRSLHNLPKVCGYSASPRLR